MNTQDILVRYDRRFRNENFYGENGFIIKSGDIPIIFSSPHAVDHCRNGKVIHGEYRTGSLALILNDIYNTYSIVKTKNLGDDINNDETSIFKTELIKLIKRKNIKYLFDFHIMAYNRPMDIDIGTAYGRSILYDLNFLQNIVNILRRNNIQNVTVDKIFSGDNQNTVISTISKECNIPCIQFEINWSLMYDKKGKFEDLFKSMVEIISNISKK